MRIKKEVSAGGIVYRKEAGKLLWLVIQHSQHKGWTFPKGLVGDTDENEAIEQAALREVKEEGGIKAKIVNDKPVRIEYKYHHQEFLVVKTVYYYLMEYISGDPADHDREVSETKFLSDSGVREILTFKTDQGAFEKILGKLKRG